VSSGHLCEAEAPTEPTGETRVSSVIGYIVAVLVRINQNYHFVVGSKASAMRKDVKTQGAKKGKGNK